MVMKVSMIGGLAARARVGNHEEHGKDGKHQPDDSNHSFIHDSKHSFCQPDDSKHLSLSHLLRRLKIMTYALGSRCETLGEHQAKCIALLSAGGLTQLHMMRMILM